MAERLESTVAVVTGRGCGIGRAIVLAFAKERARGAVTDVLVEEGEEAVQMIEENGGEVVSVETGISQAGEVAAK